MGGALTKSVLSGDKPDMKGHRAFLVGRMKPLINGEPVNWSLTKKKFEGVAANPWGVTTKVDFSVESGFLSGRKFKVGLGELDLICTELLLEFNVGGNRFLTGNLSSLTICEFITLLDLSKCPIHGDLKSIDNCKKLRTLDLSESKIVGDISSLAAFKDLNTLALRSTKITGDVKALIGMPLESIDLIDTPLRGDLTAFQAMDVTLTELKLSRSTVSGDIEMLVKCIELETLELARMPQIVGDIACMAELTALKTLVLTDTAVDCDNLAKVRNTLKKCDIRSSA